MEKFFELVRHANSELWVFALSLASAIGKVALAGESQSFNMFVRNMILAAIAIMLGTGVIEFFDIDSGSMFANGLLVLIGIYAKDILEQFGKLIARLVPAFGDKVEAYFKSK